MYKVNFDTGETVTFQNQPTDKDIEDVVKSLGIKPKAATAPETAAAPKKDFLQKASDAVSTIFPGKQIGQAIGTSIAATVEDIKGNHSIAKNIMATSPTVGQQLGDAASAMLTAGAPLVGGGPTALGRIGANTALGAGLGGATSIASGETNVGEVLKSTAIGGAIGGGVSALGEGVSKLAQNVPKWLTKTALPKLDDKNIDYAIKNTKVGSLGSLKEKSSQAMTSYEDSIQSILSHPEHIANPEYTPATLLGKTLEKFPNSNYTVNDIVRNADDLAPNVAKLLNKFEKGTANLQEINTIRKELDKATQSVYTSLSRPPEKKLLGAALSNSLRELYKQTHLTQYQYFKIMPKKLV